MSTSARTNESLLAWVESIGGNYVWEPEVFVVSLEEVELKLDEPLLCLDGLATQHADHSRERSARESLSMLLEHAGASLGEPLLTVDVGRSESMVVGVAVVAVLTGHAGDVVERGLLGQANQQIPVLEDLETAARAVATDT